MEQSPCRGVEQPAGDGEEPAALFKGLILFTHQVVVITFARVLVSEVRKLPWLVRVNSCMTLDLAGDLGGCIKDSFKCLTEEAGADSWVKRDNVCGTQCKHWSRPMYTESNGWSGEIVISDAHRCKLQNCCEDAIQLVLSIVILQNNKTGGPLIFKING